jgi:hypothetical protein
MSPEMDCQSCFAIDAPMKQDGAMCERNDAAGRQLDASDASSARSICWSPWSSGCSLRLKHRPRASIERVVRKEAYPVRKSPCPF